MNVRFAFPLGLVAALSFAALPAAAQPAAGKAQIVEVASLAFSNTES